MSPAPCDASNSAESVRQVVIDEVQEVPSQLDEVHRLQQNCKVQFALCGSSARKVQHGRANPLGGRALHHELPGLTALETREDFDLTRMVHHGYLSRT